MNKLVYIRKGSVLSRKKIDWKELLSISIFLGPSFIGFTMFFLIPFVMGIYYSLIDSPLTHRYVGLFNYLMLLNNSMFLRAAENTILFTLISVPLIMALSLFISLLLGAYPGNSERAMTSFIMPLVIPVASVVLIWNILFDYQGVINAILHWMGINGPDWMESPWARVMVLAVYLWKNTGYDVVLFTAGLKGIPAEFYETARVEGASAWQQFIHITAVYLKPMTFFVFIISIINSFKVFREVYLVAGPYPHESIYMLQHYMNNMFISLDYQKLTTAAFITAGLIYILVSLLYSYQRRSNNILD